MPGPLFVPQPRRLWAPPALSLTFKDIYSDTGHGNSFSFPVTGDVGPHVAACVITYGDSSHVVPSLSVGGENVPSVAAYNDFFGEFYFSMTWFLGGASGTEPTLSVSTSPNSYGAQIALWSISGAEPSLHDDVSSISTTGQFTLDHAAGGAIFSASLAYRATAFNSLTGSGVNIDDGPVVTTGTTRIGCGSLLTPTAASSQNSDMIWSGGSGASTIRTTAVSLAP
jgi:hypothetical protein